MRKTKGKSLKCASLFFFIIESFFEKSDYWNSTAYCYQNEPHKKFEPLLLVKERLPRKEPKEIE